MNKNILTVVGITILFLGISIQPAIAINPISSDNEDECDICPKVNKSHLVRLKSLINGVETLDNKLSVISKFHPELAEKYQELFDRITTLKEINKEYESDLSGDYPVICNMVSILIIYQLLTMIMLGAFYNENHPIICLILITWYEMKVKIGDGLFDIFMKFNCPPLFYTY